MSSGGAGRASVRGALPVPNAGIYVAAPDPSGRSRPRPSRPAPVPDPRPLVLFLCTHNSARSQLAEGLLRARHGDRYRAASAGTVARGVHPLAAEALREAGIDPAAHASKTVDMLGEIEPDVVVTVCDSARETCPVPPRAGRVVHHAFRDPSAVAGTDDDRRRAFAEVRSEIAAWLDAEFGPADA